MIWKIIACVILLLTPIGIRAVVKEYREDTRKINQKSKLNDP